MQQTDLTVATTILQQLGGKRFLVMTGATHPVGSTNSLSFQLPRKPGYVKQGINGVRITLTWRDTYTVTFCRIRGTTHTVLVTLEDIYAEDLQEAFTRETGLATRL